MMETLNATMEFDRVVCVQDGRVQRDAPSGAQLYGAPELYWSGGTHVLSHGHDWTLLDGFSGQYGYAGPIMHPSEFIGGGMETHILENPGYYVALVCEDYDEDEDDEPVGWAVAFRPFD